MKLTPALRYRGGENHHLFLNHGIWFVRYCVRSSPLLKADVRIVKSLRTRDVHIARQRRDDILRTATSPAEASS